MATVEERLEALEKQMQESAEGMYNSRHTGEEIDDAITSVKNNGKTWSGKAEKADPISLVLSKDGWDDVQKTQTLKDPLLVASDAYRYLVGSATSDSTAYSNAGVKADDITTTGEITFHCEVIPEADLTVEIMRLEVKHEQQ